MKLHRSLSAAASTLAAASIALSSCSSDDTEAPNATIPAGKRLDRDGFTIAWLHGTPYEMGYQHGKLLEPKLHEAAQFLKTDPLFKFMRDTAVNAGLEPIALANSYPWMLEECQGLVDAVADPDFTMFECLLVNFGDVAVEFLVDMPEAEDLAPGCSQLVATGNATPDGKMYHARLLDWFGVDFVVQNPVIFVREPEGGVPHLFVGFPGNLSSYQGMNAEGIVVASNEVSPRDNTVNDRTGRSHVQMVVEILSNARTLDEARQIATTANHMSFETLVVSDGKSNRAEVFELSPLAVAIRPLQDDVVFATNHFIGEKTSDLDEDPPSDSSALRFDRLTELVIPSSPTTRYGSFDVTGMIELMRDRTNPWTDELSPAEEIDDGSSLATNGALYAVVFEPASLSLWVSAGKLPVPPQAYVGFNLGEMLDMEGFETPPTMP